MKLLASLMVGLLLVSCSQSNNSPSPTPSDTVIQEQNSPSLSIYEQTTMATYSQVSVSGSQTATVNIEIKASGVVKVSNISYPAGLTGDQSCSIFLGDGQVCDFSVAVDGSASGNKLIGFIANGSHYVYLIQIGRLIAGANLISNVSSIDFGTASSKLNIVRLITFSNTGSSATSALATTAPLTNKFAISSDTCNGQILNPAQSCSLRVSFSASSLQGFASYNDSFSESGISISLMGAISITTSNGTPHLVVLSKSDPSIIALKNGVLNFVIQNQGTGAAFNPQVIVPALGANFSVSDFSCPPDKLMVGAVCAVRLFFDSLGGIFNSPYSGSLAITYGGSESALSIPLDGTIDSFPIPTSPDLIINASNSNLDSGNAFHLAAGSMNSYNNLQIDAGYSLVIDPPSDCSNPNNNLTVIGVNGNAQLDGNIVANNSPCDQVAFVPYATRLKIGGPLQFGLDQQQGGPGGVGGPTGGQYAEPAAPAGITTNGDGSGGGGGGRPGIGPYPGVGSVGGSSFGYNYHGGNGGQHGFHGMNLILKVKGNLAGAGSINLSGANGGDGGAGYGQNNNGAPNYDIESGGGGGGGGAGGNGGQLFVQVHGANSSSLTVNTAAGSAGGGGAAGRTSYNYHAPFVVYNGAGGNGGNNGLVGSFSISTY